MVVFQVVQDGDLRAVVDKLGAFVKKSGVVFICFHHKIIRTFSRRNIEILRYATDQETGIVTGKLQYPRNMLDVVVLPCVPATAMTLRPRR